MPTEAADHAPGPIATGSVAALLTGIASTAPAPGAGAAAGVALALGVACARKAVRMTLLHHADEAVLVAADARLTALGVAALAGATGDAAAFAGLIDALRLPHDAVRDAAVGQRTAALVLLGERALALGTELERVLATIADRVQPSMANDVRAARALNEASRVIQQANLDESRDRGG